MNRLNFNSARTLLRRSLWLLLLAGMAASEIQAQVSYAFNFDANSTGWTGDFSWNTATGNTCGASAGTMRRNLYSSVQTGQLISPLTGTAMGGLITIGYSYKANVWSLNTAAAPVPWGSFNVQYGPTAAGPWTTFATVTNEVQSNNVCLTKSHTFTPPAGALYVRWSAVWSGGDYYLNFDDVTLSEAVGPCTEPPTVGALQSTSLSPCTNSSFTLSIATPPTGLGLTYQWESADDAAYSVNLTALGTGATQVTSINAPSTTKYYRVHVSCSDNPAVTSTTPFSVTSSAAPVAVCGSYCIPPASAYGCTDGDVIARVILNTLDNNSGTGCPGGVTGYSDYTTTPDSPPNTFTTTLQAGGSYGCTVYAGQYGEHYAVWIDYNDDGVFSTPSERVGYTTSLVPGSGSVGVLGGSATFPINLACNPPLGVHRMRVRCMYGQSSGSTIDPCTNASSYFETEDYVVTISAAVPCPAPFALNVSGVNGATATLGWTLGCAETMWDVHFQAAGGGAPVTPSDPGLLSNSLVVNTPTPGMYEFYVRAVCGGLAGESVWSGPYVFTTNDECSGAIPLTVQPSGGCPAGNTLGTTVGSTVGSGTTSCLISGLADVWYSFNSGANTTIVWNVTLGTMGAVGVQVTSDCLGTEVFCLGDQQSGSFTVTPSTQYYFRVLTLTSTTGTFNICLQAPPPPSCLALPTSPADGGTACSTTPVTLTWPAALYATGYDVVLDGNTVSTNQPGTSYTTPAPLAAGPHTWSVTPLSPQGNASGCATWTFNASVFGCYCSSLASSTADEEIYSVTVNGVTVGDVTPYPGTNTGCTTPAPGSGSLLNQYSNWINGLTPQFIVQQGVPSTFNVQEDECDGAPYYGFGTGIWIDWNQDGDFDDVDELILQEGVTLAGPRNIPGGFTPPVTPNLGLTVMRVIVAEGWSGASLVPCLAYGYGETEDFLIDVQPPPAPASAIASINDDCTGGTFTIDVNVSSFGGGGSANIEYQVNNGPTVVVPASLGSNTIPTSGSFLQTEMVSMQLTNGTVSTLDMGDFFGSCPIEVPCGTTLSVSHCYGNNDPRVFIFVADDPMQTLTLTFIAGTMDPNDVIRTYAGTDENSSPILVSGSFASLGTPQLTIPSINDTLMLVIDSDASNSCQDTQQSTWQFEVECTPPCADPDGTAVFDLCTGTIDVNLDFEGGTTATIRYIVNGGTPVDIPGLNAPYATNIGPFNPGDAVQVLLINDDDAACTRNLGTINVVAPAGQPTVTASASPTTICAGGSSTLSAVASGGSGPIPTYVFQTETGGTLADMTGATVLLGAGYDDSANPIAAMMGFSFNYEATNYTTFFASSNGQMTLGASGNASLGNSLATSTPRPLITPWWDDLHTGSDGYVQTKLFGSPGSYIRVVEWKVRDYPGTGQPTTMLMQAWLYESGIIELRYGPSTGVSDSGASIGLAGGTANAFQSVSSPAHSVSTVTEDFNNSVWPGDGRIYRWLLPEVPGTVYTWNPGGLVGSPVLATGIASTTVFTVSAVVPGGCPEEETVTVSVLDPISSANITPASPSFCTGNSVMLTATPTSGVPPYTYQWYDPSNNPMGTAATQSANIAGTWSCAITDNCTVTVTPTVNVSSIQTPVVDVTSNVPTCAGANIVLTANTITGTPNSWLWSGAAPVGGQTTQNVALNNITSANNGSYSVVATFNGCPSASAAYVLSANPTPTINNVTATPPMVIAGQNSVLNVSASLPSASYCAASTSFGTCGGDEWIENVTFGTINNTSGCTLGAGGYADFTAQSTSLAAGASQTVSVLINTYFGGDQLHAWVDWNQDGDFVDAGEQYPSGGPLAAIAGTNSFAVTAPLTALNGSTRMRVRLAYVGAVPSCGVVNYGETEDYTVNVTGGQDALTYLWTGGSFLGGVDNTASVTADNITANTTYNVAVSSLGCTAYGSTTVLFAGNDFTFKVWTDANGGQTAYSIYQQGTNALMFSVPINSFPSNVSGFTSIGALPDGCYYLRVTDAGGDGILGGGYVLYEGPGEQRRLIDNRRDEFGVGGFTTGSVSAIAANQGFCLPMGDDRLIYTSIDKTDWRTSPCVAEYVVANDNPAVSAQYGGPNAATSGYQMWWYNPNGGYSFKRFQSHNTANGLANNAIRACHFKVNGWSGNALQQNVFYNVKVRSRVAGTYAQWGQASRFRVSNTGAACPRTKLMDIPYNQYLSCGQTRPIDANALVHAVPVKKMKSNCTYLNANRYQFRFRIPAESVTITKTSATNEYWVNTIGLACGKTYEVDVRASFNNGSSWCYSSDPYGPVCTLSTAACSFGMAQEGTSGSADEARVALYPNPNRGDQVRLSLNNVEEGVETVSVDIYDAQGVRVASRRIAVQDGFVNTDLELNGALSNGLYMVNITAGSVNYNERLVIQK
jgi:hypothetical protein